MNVEIQSQVFPSTDALPKHARRRLRFVMTRYSARIVRVSVRLGASNDPSAGADKFCRIQVHLIEAPLAVIKEIGADLYTVIDRAAERAGRVVAKHLDRSRRDDRWHGVDATALQHLELDRQVSAS